MRAQSNQALHGIDFFDVVNDLISGLVFGRSSGADSARHQSRLELFNQTGHEVLFIQFVVVIVGVASGVVSNAEIRVDFVHV